MGTLRVDHLLPDAQKTTTKQIITSSFLNLGKKQKQGQQAAL